MIKIGLVGLGVVNSGVYEIITKRSDYLSTLVGKQVTITKILVNNIEKPRDEKIDKALLTDSIDDFFTNDFDIVVEAITNTEVAYNIITRALKNSSNVVTASKAVISKYFNELFELSKENNCGLYVEASVAGGVPIIKPMLQTMQTNRITKIQAILNGTTNFILSKMYNEGSSFKESLALAQKLGYAEFDPTDDIEGFDALRKLVILSSLAYKTRLYEENIPCKGITAITSEDIGFFKDLGLIVKLIGSSVLQNHKISASIEPVLFKKSSVYNTVQLSNNIVSVTGSNVGELQFYGQGAGKLPTANSIVSDIIDILSDVSPIEFIEEAKYELLSDDLLEGNYYVRLNLRFYKSADLLDKLKASNIKHNVINNTDSLVVITEQIKPSLIKDILKEFKTNEYNYVRIDNDALDITFDKEETKPVVVMKFGGTSVSTPENIKLVASRIQSIKQQGYDVVVVVSAMGNSTDNLINMALDITDNPLKREMDLLLATGEQISISLLSMALSELKEKAIALTTLQSGIITDDFHNNASIIKVNLKRVKQELKKGNIVCIPGFQGLTKNLDITTLGRGGSDTTAVALSASLGALKCEIYTDVSGVYTADPRIVKNAKVWKTMSYDELLEMASLGAQVMHPRSVELAKKYSVPLTIKSTFDEGEGTKILEGNMIEKVLVRGVTLDKDIVKVSIMEVPDKPGIAYHLFDLLADQKVNIDTIIQAVSRENINDISFTVHKKDLDVTVEACNTYVNEIHTGNVLVDENVVKLSIVGIGIANGYRVASTFFKALYETNINIQMISTSELKISCIITNKDVDIAINKVHDYFQLGEELNEE